MDVELTFSTADLAHSRFAVSPMWEVVTSYRLLRSAAGNVPHRHWLAEVRPRVSALRLDSGPLSELIPRDGYLADFLNPTPARPFPDLSEELAAIRATGPEQVRAELDLLAARLPSGREEGPGARALRADPVAGLERVTAEITAYWEAAVAPYWARVRKLLEADVFGRAREAAEYGTGHVMAGLHETIQWEEGALRLAHRVCALERGTSGQGVLLVPSAFVWPRVLTRAATGESPQIAYPARGVGNLWAERRSSASEALAAVLGRSRARLLAELDSPASTTRLARLAALSAPGVSQHLTALRDAGLVSAHRSGREVLYARTAVAEALLGSAA
ncbi:DUF5937 family protein [Streptomyces sp. NPDC007088]|uniref:ArsR/SmtB family transcription factor n=1 Tax=Streptomyces sp. NPDC007088 TaxID=3364773 RepID=UPI00367799B8